MEAIEDRDRDSLYALPLSIVPLKTQGLRTARMVKNTHLDSVLELFHEEDGGSGQIDIREVGKAFGWSSARGHPDYTLLYKLREMPSFDVYSLRILLRDQEIPVNDYDDLKLSESKQLELREYMNRFTRPLIMNVYGDIDVNLGGYEDIINLFRDPDVKRARDNLRRMSNKLGIKLEEVPKYLEDYGDIFLSISYYKRCMDLLKPTMLDLFRSIEEISTNAQLKQNSSVTRGCSQMKSTLTRLKTVVDSRFTLFDHSSTEMWKDLDAKRFREFESMIQSNHTMIGGVLCALTVKLDAWSKKFPDRDAGGPNRRADFIISEMIQGIENIERIKTAAARKGRLH